MDKLVTSRDIADRLGIADAAVIRNWRKRYADFPAPVLERQDTIALWYWPEIEEWARKTNRWPVKDEEQ